MCAGRMPSVGRRWIYDPRSASAPQFDCSHELQLHTVEMQVCEIGPLSGLRSESVSGLLEIGTAEPSEEGWLVQGCGK